MSKMSSDLSTILESAMRIFLRYGFKKTSMSDVAVAAGISRQWLYLKFETKDRLFEAALHHFVEAMLEKCRKGCVEGIARAEERLAEVFATLHGEAFRGVSEISTDASELLALARSRHGVLVAQFEREFVTMVAALLTTSGIAKPWAEIGLSSTQLAEHLLATSSGIKASATSDAGYRARMAVAIAVVTRMPVSEHVPASQ